MTQTAPPMDLRARAESLGDSLPALLAAADHLAATMILGEHGRRRAGMGDEFWQYRPAHAAVHRLAGAAEIDIDDIGPGIGGDALGHGC